METTSRSDGFDGRVISSIRYHASRLDRAGAVPGMEKTDYEQDFLVDLLHRKKSFCPELSTFRTFADRLIRNRINTITSPTRRLKAEREWTPIDGATRDRDGVQRALAEMLPAEPTIADVEIGLQLDVRRFVGGLPADLRTLCDILVADSVVEAVRTAGIARSTAYQRAVQLRERAFACGLHLYLKPDILEEAAVYDQVEPAFDLANEDIGATAIPAAPTFLSAISTTERDFSAWLERAGERAVLEYHRGNLAMQIGVEGPGSEIARLADRARWACNRGLVHLVQLRHGFGDYSYLAVMRPKNLYDADPVSGPEVRP
jgi:hypothetical protein